MSILVKPRTPESISTSADWLNKRAAIFRRNGQNLSATMCEQKAHRLFQEAKELRNQQIEAASHVEVTLLVAA